MRRHCILLSRVVCIFQFQPKYLVCCFWAEWNAVTEKKLSLNTHQYRFPLLNDFGTRRTENTISTGYIRIQVRRSLCVSVNFLISVANRKKCREFYLSNCVEAEEEQTNENNEQNILSDRRNGENKCGRNGEAKKRWTAPHILCWL